VHTGRRGGSCGGGRHTGGGEEGGGRHPGGGGWARGRGPAPDPRRRSEASAFDSGFPPASGTRTRERDPSTSVGNSSRSIGPQKHRASPSKNMHMETCLCSLRAAFQCWRLASRLVPRLVPRLVSRCPGWCPDWCPDSLTQPTPTYLGSEGWSGMPVTAARFLHQLKLKFNELWLAFCNVWSMHTLFNGSPSGT
jgi:hypothetical protein